MELQQLRKIKLELDGFKPVVKKEFSKMDITPNPCWEGYEPIGLKDDGSPNCVPIKASKEDFIIPTPDSGESEQDYIGRCIGDIGKEYDVEGQAYAVCKGKWDEKK